MKRKRYIFYLVMMLVVGVMLSQVVAAGPEDVEGHWAGAAIGKWTERRMIRGYPDGSFRPDAPITRAEFVVLINRLFGYMTEDSVIFSDVGDEDWFALDVRRAAGYMQGYPDGTFRPNESISRQEVAAVLVRVAELEEGGVIPFSDRIPEWSRPYVAAAVKAGLVKGYPDGTFKPENGITRAESVVIMDRLVSDVVLDGGIYEDLVTDGSVIVLSSAEMRNCHVRGDLYLAENSGASVLAGTIVDGRIIINSADRIDIRDVTARGVIVNRAGDISLSGGFDTVNVKTGSGRIGLAGGHVNNFFVESSAGGIMIDNNATIDNLVLNAPATVDGIGAIQLAVINVSGSRIKQRPAKVILGEGVTATIAGILVGGEDAGDSSDGGGGSGSSGGGGGSDDDKPSHVKVKSIQVTPQTMLLQVGRTGSIKVTVTPANASNKKVIWTSSDPGIATVDGSGKVTAVSPGVAVITAASAENTKIKASCIVTVTEYNVISNMLQVTIEAR